jgi:hypothetical protein
MVAIQKENEKKEVKMTSSEAYNFGIDCNTPQHN